jgi:hypothetical protein
MFILGDPLESIKLTFHCNISTTQLQGTASTLNKPRVLGIHAVMWKKNCSDHCELSPIFRVLLCQPLLNSECTNTRWDWTCSSGTKERTVWSIPRHNVYDLTALNLNVTRDLEESQLVPNGQGTNYTSSDIILDASRAWKAVWLSEQI